MTLAEVLMLTLQLEALRKRIREADSAEQKEIIAAELLAFLKEHPELNVNLGGSGGVADITPADVARDVETFNLTQA